MARLTMTEAATADVLALCIRVYGAASELDRQRCRWVMSRPWYDRLRAQACTEEQEAARARAHATVWVNAMAAPPHKCPACGTGPFTAMGEVTAHIAAMADPANREPGRDYLLGIPVDVRDHGGEPHLETPAPPPDPPWVYLAKRLAELSEEA